MAQPQPQAQDVPAWLEQLLHGMRGRRKPITAPTFNGEGDVRAFLRNFHEVAEVNEWDDEERSLRLRLSLQGRATGQAEDLDYAGLAETLIARYEISREEARRELKHLRLRAGQDIFAFGEQLMKLIRIAEPELRARARDERATAELIEAIGDKHLTREFRLQGPIDFNDALRRVQQYNIDMRQTRNRRLELEEDDEEGELKRRLIEVETRMDQLEQVVTTTSTKLVETMAKSQKDLMEAMKKVGDKVEDSERARCAFNQANVAQDRYDNRARFAFNQANVAPRYQGGGNQARFAFNQANAAYGRGSGRQVQGAFNKAAAVCFNCQQRGHFANECSRGQGRPTVQGNSKGPE